MLNDSALHALRAVAELGTLTAGHYMGAADLAGRIRAPQNYLGKLLQALARRGVVAGRKGQGGGFRLARPAGSISLLEVLDPKREVARLQGCLLNRPGCRADRPCAAHAHWARLRNAYMEFLTGTAVSDLIGEDRRGPALISSPRPERGRKKTPRTARKQEVSS
jgi:Rrf2 family transcriptional regulator, iron-sulfur cluster assembly transcription factor